MTNHRPFKFRVWDNLKKEWLKRKIYHASIRIDGDGIGDFEFRQHPQGYTIQQFTGLTDRTGREIYEGDICGYKWYRYDFDIEESTGEVFFEDGIFLFGRKDLFCSSDSNFRVDSLEVIGNVFENTELQK